MAGYDFIAVLGGLGVVLMEASYVPQLLKLYRVKHADEISLYFPLMNFVGRVFLLIYSLDIGANIFILGFAFGLLLRGSLVLQVLYYRKYGKHIVIAD